MRSIISRVLVPALLFSATPLAAQQRDLWTEYDGPRRLEFAVNGGMFLSSDWSDLVYLETFGDGGNPLRQVLLREFAMAPEFGGTASVTYWRGRYGFRVHAGFVRSCLTTGNRCEDTAPAQTGLAGATIDMDTWAYGVQGVVGLIEHTRGQWFRPYLIVGGGGMTYDLADPLSTILPGPFTSVGPGRVGGGGVNVTLPNNPSTVLVSVDEVSLETRFALNLGVGTDFRIPVGPGGVGLRLELSDQISQSPIALRVARLDGGFRTPGIGEIHFDGRTVHNWRLSAGLMFEFGLRGYEPPPVEY